MRRAVLPLLAALALAPAAAAYPELEVFVERRSGQYIDCAMCHSHAEGPEGVKPGQIRSLDREELERLNLARRQFEPGGEIDSPVLNDFGDLIVHRLGKRRLLQLRTSDPAAIATELGFDSDLDGDGIPDAREYLDGTDPLDAQHGRPAALLAHNLETRWFHLLMLALATGSGLVGLKALLRLCCVRDGDEPPRREG